MAISWGLPKLVSKILEAVPAINYLLNALAKMDYTGTTDIPIGAVRMAQVEGGWQLQRYNGNSWVSVGKLIHDADTVDGKSASTDATADTIPVRDSSGKVPGDITGNAATASSAAALSTTLPVNGGGTGATNSEGARSNLGVPPTSHASTGTTYGLSSASQYGHAMAASDDPAQDTDAGSVGSDVTHFARGDHAHKKVLGTSSVYGQVKLTDSVSDGSDASSSVAASAKAVKDAYDKALSASNAAVPMTGATASSAGKAGLAPQPAAGEQNKPLTGGGEYADSLDCDITGHASKDLPLTGGTVTGGIYPKKAQLPLGSVSNFWNIYAKYIEFITEAGVSVGSFNAFEYEGRHILGLYPNMDVGAQIHLGSEAQPLEKVHVNRLNGCWGDGLNVSIEKPAAIYQYGVWGDSYSGGWYVRLTNGVQIVAVAYANGATGQDVWIPFPVPFKDSSYASVCMPLAVSSNTMANAGVTNRQTTGCTFSTQFGSGIYNISVCGIFMGWF